MSTDKSSMFSSIYDSYSLRARLLPALLTIAPLLIIFAVLFPSIYTSLMNVVGSIGAGAGFLFLLSHFIRQKGRALEKRLHEKWGGLVTTIWLRQSDSHIDALTKSRYHRFLEANVPGYSSPSIAAEKQNPEAADRLYASATKWLLEYTRDIQSYRLIFEENITYGFRRNLLAAKVSAYCILLLCTGVLIGTILYRGGFPAHLFSPDVLVCFALLAVVTLAWIVVPNEDWVRDAADAYARALLAACEAKKL